MKAKASKNPRRDLTLRQCAAKALMCLQPVFRPNPLPVGSLIGWLETIDENDRFAAVAFLETLITNGKNVQYGPHLLAEVEGYLALANDAVMQIDSPAPAMTPRQIAEKLSSSPLREVSTPSSVPAADGDGSTDAELPEPDTPQTGLESFTKA